MPRRGAGCDRHICCARGTQYVVTANLGQTAGSIQISNERRTSVMDPAAPPAIREYLRQNHRHLDAPSCSLGRRLGFGILFGFSGQTVFRAARVVVVAFSSLHQLLKFRVRLVPEVGPSSQCLRSSCIREPSEARTATNICVCMMTGHAVCERAQRVEHLLARYSCRPLAQTAHRRCCVPAWRCTALNR